ncbi:MAG: carbon monoxide dehydrogenase subunit G, partial [Caldimonas sp.]
MELDGERLIPATLDATWAALNDPATLKACIAGCESLERTGDDAFAAVVALKIGPVSARFKGNLKMTDVRPPNGYTIHFDGQGGVAGFGKGSAEVALTADGAASTKLAYAAKATVGGKMAQIGSRLIDATAAKITEEF